MPGGFVGGFSHLLHSFSCCVVLKPSSLGNLCTSAQVQCSECSGMLTALTGKATVCCTWRLLSFYLQLTWCLGTAGFLPFSAIYIELYYIFASVWGHKVYTIYSILFIVFIILIIVTAFITIALTYFQLAVEDHRWWWRSFMCGGSTGKQPYCQSCFRMQGQRILSLPLQFDDLQGFDCHRNPVLGWQCRKCAQLLHVYLSAPGHSL